MCRLWCLGFGDGFGVAATDGPTAGPMAGAVVIDGTGAVLYEEHARGAAGLRLAGPLLGVV